MNSARRLHAIGLRGKSKLVVLRTRRASRVTWRIVQVALAMLGVACAAFQLGVPGWLALLIGVTAGLAAWRPPPRGATAHQPSTGPGAVSPTYPAGGSGADLVASPSAMRAGLDLGRIVSAPSQPVALVPNRRFWLALDELERHVTLIGTSGSGKTTTLARLMDAALSAGWSVLVVDAKGGRLANVCGAIGAAHDQPTRIWLPGHPDSCTYDPCAGEPTAIGNRLVGAFEHGRDGQVYRNVSQALVPLAARSLLESGQPCTLDTLRFSLDEAHLAGLARRVTDVQIKAELVAMLQDALHRKALSGLVGRFRSLRFGVFGPWLLPSDHTLDLAACLGAPGITYMGLPATAASEDVALVGRVLIQHLKQVAYVGLWSDEPRPGLVVFDEFASLGEAVQLLDLLLQAREARLAVVVSTQQLPREPVLRKALLGSGMLLVHQVGAPEDADALARALGTRAGTEIVRQIQLGPAGPLARRFLRNRESYLVSPDELARLPVGQAAVSVRFALQRIALVEVDPLRISRKES